MKDGSVVRRGVVDGAWGLIKAKQAAESADRENICQRNNYGTGT